MLHRRHGCDVYLQHSQGLVEMLETFECLTVNYYGNQVRVSQLANLRQLDERRLRVKPFDPLLRLMDELILLGLELGWTYTLGKSPRSGFVVCVIFTKAEECQHV